MAINHRVQVRKVSENEARLSLLYREFMIGAFSAIAGDAIAREVHEGHIEHVVEEMGMPVGPNTIFPMAFLVLLVIVRVPIFISSRVLRRRRVRRIVHHVIRP